MLASLLSLALSSSLVPPAPELRERASGAHYEVTVAGTQEEADELVLVLEQCWPLFQALIQAQPELEKGERLACEVYSTRDAWMSGVLAKGQAPPADADGMWFQPSSRKLHVARHPVPYVTRAHVIHGACVQFHGLAKKKFEDLGRTWYVQGLAEMLSIHAYDRGKLELAASPRVCVLDPAAQTLAALGGKPRLWREQDLERPGVRWAIVRFARDGAGGRYRPAFEKLALGWTGSKSSGRDFLQALGREEKVGPEFEKWLLAAQLPLEVLAWSFEELPNHDLLAVPSGKGLALCRLRAPARSIEATIYNGRDQRGSAGLLLSKKAPSEIVIARFTEPMLFIERLSGDDLVDTEPVPLARNGEGRVRVRAEIVPDGVRVSIDGQPAHTFETETPELGLAAFWNPVVFEDVVWR